MHRENSDTTEVEDSLLEQFFSGSNHSHCYSSKTALLKTFELQRLSTNYRGLKKEEFKL